MSTRERERREQRPAAATPEETGGVSPGMVESRERSERLAAAGERAIRDALSQDSARFIAQNRQEGGE
jgi:hypothetical protein